MSSECRWGSARLWRMARPRLPSDSCGRAEMCGHRFIQRRQVLVSLFFSAVNRCKSSWGRRTNARRVGGASRFCELVVYFREEGGERWRRAWWRPGRNHLSSLLRDGSSGADHSSPSSLTALVITRMSSSSARSLALREADGGKRAGPVTEPDSSSASEASKAAIQFIVTHTERDHVARSRCRGAESDSETKLRVCTERQDMKLAMRVDSPSAASTWDLPKHDTHSTWVSSALQWWRGICNNALKFALLVRFFGSTPDGCRAWPSLQAGCSRGPNPTAWGVSMVKKGVHRWREEIWDAVAEQLII